MQAFEYQPTYRKTVLSNGVRVITEHHPYSRATSSGIYVNLGTRDEPSDMVGAAHFVEHMVFKGTKTRTAYDIASQLESVGGDLNAYTTREYTCFHASTLKEHVPLALDVLVDLMNCALFVGEDFRRERDVIFQEINMSADVLEDYIFDIYFEEAYRGHNLGRSILGTEDSLKAITKTKLKKFYKDRYKGENMVVAVAGSVDHDQVVDMVSKALARVPKSSFVPEKRKSPKIKGFTKVIPKSSEQEHVILGMPSSKFKDKNRFDSYVLNAVIGGGVTSRLYQTIRENKGWAYSVYSYLHAFTDSGLLMLYAGTAEANISAIYDEFFKEIWKIKDKGITRKELDFFKTQVKGNILLGADDIENRMNSLGVNEMIFNKYRSVDTVLKDIDSVSNESVLKFAQKHFDVKKMGMIVMGDVNEDSMSHLLKSYK